MGSPAGLTAIATLAVLVSVVAAQGPSSCVGKCGKWSDHCWCNDGCEARGDCCSDYSTACGSGSSCAKCPGGKYNCDEWIEWDASKYTCQSLQNDFGCNCTGCSNCGGPVPSSAAVLKLLDKAAHPDARCLDGSQAGYYIRKGMDKRYLIFFEGGGWCYDQQCASPTKEGTLRDCQKRANSSLGSSSYWPLVMDNFKGSLSADQRANPVFHNWTMVYVPYCDGTSFSGDAVVGSLHFKGKAVLSALLTQLKRATDIKGARQVVVSGGSAGASTVYYHIDAIAEQLALEAGEVMGLPDAGFFLDLKDKDGIDCWPGQMRSLFDLANGYGSLHGGCLQRFPKEPWKCMFPEYYADLVKTPVFVINTLYDSSEIECTLRLSCCPGGCGGRSPTCNAAEMQLLEALRRKHIEAWAPLVGRRGSGVWAPACIRHTVSRYEWTDQTWEVPAHSGVTQAAAVQRWVRGGGPPADGLVYQDNVSWPHNRPCASSDAGSARDLFF